MGISKSRFILPERVLAEVYGKTSKQLDISEKRRDEAIAAAIFTCFHNQEFGTRFKLPSDYRSINFKQDAQGIDVVVANENGRHKKLQIKGVHIKRSITRRMKHTTKGVPKITGRKSLHLIKRDSEEISRIMAKELGKIIQDYTGIILIIDVKADFATQTSLEIAIKNCREILEDVKAKEIWFMRNIPVRAINGKRAAVNSHAYKLIKLMPNKHTYGFSFAL